MTRGVSTRLARFRYSDQQLILDRARRSKERRETGEHDLFRSRLDQIIDLDHALAKLAKAIDWHFLEEKFGEVYSDKPGHPRLMAGLAMLKHTYDLSDEALCDRWVENRKRFSDRTALRA